MSVGTLVGELMPGELRWALFGAGSLLLGFSDVFHHTPQWPRQVPKKLVDRLGAFNLGAVWGFDLGLISTTRKVSSITWVGLLGVLLLARNSALPVLAGGVCASAPVLVIRSVTGLARRVDLRRHLRTIVLMQRLSGVLGVAAARVVLYVSAILLKAHPTARPIGTF